MKHNFPKLIISIIACELAGVIGSLAMLPSIASWYASLTKPFFTPPSWAFGPVWTILYLLMGVAVYLVWINKSKNTQPAINIFTTQLVLNVLWSIAFFGLFSPLLGFIVIVLLWLSITFAIKEFSKISKSAAWLLVPYIVWVTIAAALNLGFLLLN